MSAVNQVPKLAGVYEQGFAAAVAVFVVFLIAGQEPETGGNGRRIKELAREHNHAVHEVGFNDVLSDFAFAGLIGRHGAVGEDKAGDTGGREMIDDVLHPGEVGVSDWWFAELPAFVVAQ